MSKKKRFGISEALTRGLSETINVVENNLGTFRNVILPLSRIELDPDNPRKLTISIEDVKMGLKPTGSDHVQKLAEYEKLKELAHTIKTSGVINPIVVYKQGEHYRVVAGERRCLASLMIGKQEIEARVFNERPKGFDLKLIQWIENTAREDLTLAERLDNIREILTEYQKQHVNKTITATTLKEITGLSLSQTTYYLSVISAPEDIQFHIQQGNIRNLDKAALLASIASAEVRTRAIEACINGSSLKELRSIIHQDKLLKKTTASLTPSKQGRRGEKVAMGTTIKGTVIQTIVESVVQQKPYVQHATLFSNIDWSNLRHASKAFRKLIEILELEMAG